MAAVAVVTTAVAVAKVAAASAAAVAAVAAAAAAVAAVATVAAFAATAARPRQPQPHWQPPRAAACRRSSASPLAARPAAGRSQQRGKICDTGGREDCPQTPSCAEDCPQTPCVEPSSVEMPPYPLRRFRQTTTEVALRRSQAIGCVSVALPLAMARPPAAGSAAPWRPPPTEVLLCGRGASPTLAEPALPLEPQETAGSLNRATTHTSALVFPAEMRWLWL
eukprot:scaffold52054_cov59-Phaeocystis_antarctica.AAC.4